MKKQDKDTKIVNKINIYYLHKGDNIPFYIGKTIHPILREQQHKGEKGSNIHMEIINSVNKDEWKFEESFWIEQFKQWGFILENKNNGGGGPLSGVPKPKGFGIGRIHSDYTKNKIGLSNKGNKGPLGYIRSEETKQKISKSNSKPKPEGFKEKLRNIKLNIPLFKGRIPIIQYDLKGNFIKEWDGAVTIKKELNINNVSVMQCCRGIIKTSNNYIWKYKN